MSILINNNLLAYRNSGHRSLMTAFIIGLAGTILAVTFCASPAQAEEDIGMSPSVFSRELIDSVDHSLIAIWMMMTGGGIMQAGSICSGVIFQSVPEENAAYALTNYHCVQTVALFQVELWDGSTYLARLVAQEPGIDTGFT